MAYSSDSTLLKCWNTVYTGDLKGGIGELICEGATHGHSNDWRFAKISLVVFPHFSTSTLRCTFCFHCKKF